MISALTLCFLIALDSVAAFGPAAVNLHTAANYGVLNKAGVSNLPPSAISKSSQIRLNSISDEYLHSRCHWDQSNCCHWYYWGLILDPSGQFATSTQVVGKITAASYATPTPATLTVAIGDMATAFADATGRLNPNFTNLASAIGGLVFVSGLYHWASAVTIRSNVTISGTPTDRYLDLPSPGHALGCSESTDGTRWRRGVPGNIVWAVTGAVSAAAGAHLEGVILGNTPISLMTGASANSRLLAQTSVALQQPRLDLDLHLVLFHFAYRPHLSRPTRLPTRFWAVRLRRRTGRPDFLAQSRVASDSAAGLLPGLPWASPARFAMSKPGVSRPAARGQRPRRTQTNRFVSSLSPSLLSIPSFPTINHSETRSVCVHLETHSVGVHFETRSVRFHPETRSVRSSISIQLL
ncbi:hypothetical protein C8F04DRAFT_1295589 [Mycena alexandri]|uniref:Uncharacterized protein n=1 Tax=Mycena alexandri TaxID=1745969 RepID=A0AAD6SFK2_9AGAR|nr:hypothetical protein C8F04DRAFT_1295589 [Mycena alexandri]